MDREKSTGGIDFIGALQLSFIVLKLCGFIDWSWYKVLIPAWLYMGVCIVGLIAFWNKYL